MIELHPPILQLYVAPSSIRIDSDPSIITPIYTMEIDPLEGTPSHMIRLDSEAISSRRGSHVSERGHWQDCGDGQGAGSSG